MNNLFRRPMICTLALVAVHTANAAADIVNVEGVRFSPDGSFIAYVRLTTKTSLPLPDAEIMGHTARLYWAKAPAFDEWKSRQLFPRKKGDTEKKRHVYADFSFSPNSSRIAAVSHHGVECIDLNSGEKHVCFDGNAHCNPAWLSKDEIAFATTGEVGVESRLFPVHFWRIRADSVDRVATKITTATYEGDWPFSLFTQRLDWSPNGRFVVVPPTSSNAWALVELATGKTLAFGGRRLRNAFYSVSWRSDDSLVMCINNDATSGRSHGCLVDTRKMQARDVTAEIEKLEKSMEASGDTPFRVFGMDALWTWDGKSIVFRNALILDPDSWEVTDVRKHIAKLYEKRDASILGFWRLAVPGWFMVCCSSGDPSTSRFEYFLLDSTYTRLRKINEVDRMTLSQMASKSRWHEYISPDGTHLVRFDPNGSKVTVIEWQEPLVPIPLSRPAK